MTKMVFKVLAATLFSAAATTTVQAQTLVTYGNQPVSKQDFLKAYSKNNADKSPTEKSYRDYLELYIRYKLKVRAALDQKLDTLPNQAAEMKNFRNQVVESYIKDEETLNKLVNEAFTRSLKDIHLAHIFIAVPKNATPEEELQSRQKAMQAAMDLQKGKTFEDVAVKYSEDPSVQTNHGDIGYITAFTLPYELETVAYSTPAGQYSKPFQSKAGYHIFKNLGERKAIGRIRTAQILFLFPPNATDSVKATLKEKADTVYAQLMNGASFSELAKKYSGDNLSFQTGGEMAEFGTGKFEAVFETAAFGLSKDGEISEPVRTEFGYHIIKRLSRKPVPEVNNKETTDLYTQKVMNDPRIEYSKKMLLQKVLRDENVKRYPIDQKNLWAYTDSFLLRRPLPKLPGIEDKTVLFGFAKKNITIKDWLAYIKGLRPVTLTGAGKTNNEYLDQYLETTAFEYYRNHLEDYNKDFAYQLNEFREGNLLFEIMQRKIWDKASADSIGLKKYYEAHKNKYWWEPSADAVLFTCSNEKTATDMQKKIRELQVGSWRMLVDSSAGMAQADSGRFELSQLPMAEQKSFAAGQFTSMNSNPTDNTVTFAYLIKLYNERSPRNYSDARGFVINDYQAWLEDNWIAELKKKYPVKVDETVFKSLPR